MSNKVLNPQADRQYYSQFYPIDTRWADNDIYGHVNNVTYYAYFDTVINRFLIEQGGLDIHQGQQIGFIVQSQCQYFSPVAFPDELIGAISIKRIGNSSVDYTLAIFQKDAPQASAVGAMTHVFVDKKTNRPSAITGQLKQALLSLLVTTSHNQSSTKG
jgi:acyl-CoA thioester hydrolase